MLNKCFAFICVLIFLLPAAQAAGEAPEPQKFDDWAKLCEKDADNKEACFIFQSVTRKENQQLLMNIRVGYSRKDTKGPLMILTVPTGVLLPAGAAFMVEGADPIKLDYLTCSQAGCITLAAPISDAVLEGMKKKKEGVVRIANTQQKVVGIPVSLRGFTRGFASLPAPR